MKGKHYTVMVIPHTRARFSRWRLSAAFVVALSVIAALAIISTGLLPVYMHMSSSRADEIEALRQENRDLKIAGMEMDQSLSTLRDQVGYFEMEATKFALMAGIQDLPSAQPAGGVREVPAPAIARPNSTISAGRMLDEATTLQERSGVLMRSFNLLDKTYHDQDLLLASTPSIMPVRGLISYRFGWRTDPFTDQRAFHHGLDIVAMIGTPVAAPADGIVVRARREAGYGNVVFISHGNGVTTRYAHLSAISVRAGDQVHRGDLIGKVGNTGRSLGYHLHYEVLVHGTKVNPMNYILDLDRTS